VVGGFVKFKASEVSPGLNTEAGIYSRDQVVQVVDQGLGHYQTHCVQGERFGTVLERCPLDTDREECGAFILLLCAGKGYVQNNSLLLTWIKDAFRVSSYIF
jgi:hypothetical protein